MRVDQISNLQALAFVAGVIVFSVIVLRVVPGDGLGPRRSRTPQGDVAAYDRYLPKYFLAALAALIVGGLHAAIKSVPPVFAWLYTAGEAGHLIRDIANSHLVIVIGGTVSATGLVFYVLPRVCGRPLWSHRLAGWSFWCTVLGAAGFYVANVVLGLVLGARVHAGVPFEQAREALGVWRALPIGLTATVMGIGYWTFALEVVLTVAAARRAGIPGRHRHLTKFFVVGALGLFAGTVQGVIQVMPGPRSWIKAAGAAGEYVDPIAHAHVNLVTGLLVLTAGLLFWWTGGGSVRSRRAEQTVFWTLVPGSVVFYASFLTLGLLEGRLVSEGMGFAAAVRRIGAAHVGALAFSGALTAAGLWLLIATLLRRMLGSWAPSRRCVPLVTVGCVSLIAGSLQGLVQLAPATKRWIESAGAPGDALANAHAQLNMLGGVVPLLLGLCLLVTPALGAPALRMSTSRRIATLVFAGVGVYWLAAVTGAVAGGNAVRHSGDAGAGLGGASRLAATGMMAGALVYATGFGMLGAAWARWAGATVRDGWSRMRSTAASYDGPESSGRARVPARYYLMAEAVAAAVGFPGVGWIFRGRARVGLPLALAGPAVAWAVLPLLTPPSPAGSSVRATVAYLAATTVASVAALAVSLRWPRVPSERVPSERVS